MYVWEVREQTLGEASVTASKVLMVMKGDTIEYNAAAFRMSEGSMLDNLVAALPGVAIDNGGRITVNGEFVSELLVNGRDFFRGDPRVALSNLPAYTVNKIQVYRQPGVHARMQKERAEEEKKKDPLVMNVKLKREYEQGWITNYELAGGAGLKDWSDGKWLGRLFAMRYTNHSSIALYANANNLNDVSSPGRKGEWKRTDASAGEKTSYQSGVDFSIDPKNTRIKVNTSLQALRQESKLSETVVGEDFLTGGNVFSQASRQRGTTSTDLTWNGNFRYDVPGRFLSVTPELYYRHHKEKEYGHAVKSMDMAGLDTLYSRTHIQEERKTEWGGRLHLYSIFPILKQNIDLSASVDYNRLRDEDFQRDQIQYVSPNRMLVPESRNFHRPAFDYKYSLWMCDQDSRNRMKIAGDVTFFPTLVYSFRQSFSSGHQDLSRNEEDWLTPSVHSEQQWVIDMANSFHTARQEREHYAKLSLRVDRKKYAFGYSPAFRFVQRRISDYRDMLLKESRKDHALLDHSMYIHVGDISLNAVIEHQLPDIYYLLDVRDESDPLVRYRGNSGLKTTIVEQYWVETTIKKKEYSRNLFLKGMYKRWRNSVSMAQMFDRTTNVTTFRPFNIDGNWQVQGVANYSRFLDKESHWHVSNISETIFAHSVDFMADNSEIPVRQAVDNLKVKDELTVRYQINSLRVGAKTSVDWARLESRQGMFERFSYVDFSYGLTLSAQVFLGVNLDTDLMAYSRRGYNDHTMNTTDWVWNVSLDKTLGRHKQWTLKVSGFDLLQQLSNTRRTVNAQGRVETRYNTIPAYAMFHVAYRLDVIPKKRT